MYIKNFFGHLKTVLKHKWYVFKLCVKAGIPYRGLVHDLSKFSPTEFFESVKYYNGKRSPITFCKQDKGYSEAWLHHKGRNKHHYQYWFDEKANPKAPVMPYKYAVEMLCDTFAAGMTYQGKNWTNEYQLNYWKEKERPGEMLNSKMHKFLEIVYTEVAKDGIDKVINKKQLKEIYNNCINGD